MRLPLPPPPRHLFAEEYLNHALKLLPRIGTSNKPAGTLVLLPGTWTFSKTWRCPPANVNVQSEAFSAGASRRGDYLLTVTDDFPLNNPLMSFAPSDGSNHNGNFSWRCGGFRIEGRNRCAGIEGGGAQQSLFANVEERDVVGFGLNIKDSSRSLRVEDCNFYVNGGVGIKSYKTNNITLLTNSFHHCDTVLDLKNCNGWRCVDLQVAEHCKTMVVLDKGDANHRFSFAIQDADSSGELNPIADFSQARSNRNNRIEGTINKTASPFWYPPGVTEPTDVPVEGGAPSGSFRPGYNLP